MRVRLWVPCCHRLVARNWKLASSGWPFTAPMVANSVSVDAVHRLGRAGLLARRRGALRRRAGLHRRSPSPRGPVIGLVPWASDGIAGGVPGRSRRRIAEALRGADSLAGSGESSTRARSRRAARRRFVGSGPARSLCCRSRLRRDHDAVSGGQRRQWSSRTSSPSVGSTRSSPSAPSSRAPPQTVRVHRALVRNLAQALDTYGAAHRVRRAAGSAPRARVLVRRRVDR